MPSGLTVFNTGNTVQIDENWKNYGFRQTVSVGLTSYATSPPNPTGFNGATYTLTLTGSPQLLVACKASTLLPVKMHCYYDSGTWTMNWLFLPPFAGTYSETVTFYVFDQMDSIFSNVGLEVFNASGERVYHSDAPVMRLGSDSNVGVQDCVTGFAGDSGRDYVPLILINPLRSYNPGAGYRLSSHSLQSFGSYITSTTTGPLGALGGTIPYDFYGLYAAIDVTGLS